MTNIDLPIILQNAKHILQSAWETDNPIIQFASAEAYAALKNPIVAPILLQTLTSPDPFLRDRAIQALGNLQDPKYIPDIIPLFQDEDDATRAHAFAAYANIQPKKIHTQLKYTLQNRYYKTMEIGIELAAQLPEQKGQSHLKKTLNLDYFPYRLQILAAKYLAEQNHPKGWTFLQGLLQHNDRWIQFLGARQLAHLHNQDGKQILIKMIQEGDWEAKILALEALLEIETSEEWIQDLKRPWEAPETKDRLQIIQILNKYQPKQTEKLLQIEWNQATNEETKEKIIEIIGQLHEPKYVEIIKDIAIQGQEHLKATFLHAIQKLNDISLIPYVFPIIVKSHWLVQIQASKVVLIIALQKNIE
ncbi:MAG: HEAT repeat domain-containing protein [Planctomycetes bacterium]|nr:HEAT repeat domain-containing protein [Planctomycetota bacterium]HPY74988.1 HEAT repeat domain-containing protein [Planctomycetota bacterium]HQB01345.1 HEAT repeat domain-containing protein [Planctomycetota bacterium]